MAKALHEDDSCSTSPLTTTTSFYRDARTKETCWITFYTYIITNNQSLNATIPTYLPESKWITIS